jgi:hypothetical protein
MNFQVEREDRQALADASNREHRLYLEYLREQRELEARYQAEAAAALKECQSDINTIKVGDLRITVEERKKYIAQAMRDVMRSEAQFAEDQRHARERERAAQWDQYRRVTDNLNKMTEIREAKLLNFAEEHVSLQVERQFNRQRELDHQVAATKQEEAQTRKELEFLMRAL